jgi:NAD(P)H-flavin reductase
MNAAAEHPMLPRPHKVRHVRRETEDTITMELAPADGGAFAFAAGQFNMLFVPGVGEVPISISGDPTRPARLIHTTRAVGAVTTAICGMRPGAVVGVRGPFGVPWPVREAEGSDVVIVAGGIGLAPLRPAIYHLLAERAKYGKIVLLYGARTPAELLFRREVEQWRSRFDLDVNVTVDRAVGPWHANVGVVTTLLPRAVFDHLSTVAMVCGPEIMMRFTALELEKLGIPKDHIYLSMERNMKCGIGLCGHCQCGPAFICKDGPVFRYDRLKDLLAIREI